VPEEQLYFLNVRWCVCCAGNLIDWMREFVCEVNRLAAPLLRQMQNQIEALTVGLQKVSAQLELNKPASQTVLNDQ
jgi:hypothetical protein